MTTDHRWSRRTFLIGSTSSAVCLAAKGTAKRIKWKGGVPSAITTNLVPARGGRTLSYWCAWNVMLDSAKSAGSPADHLTQNAGRAFTERHVFGPPGGWIRYFAPVRKDLLFFADLGWDISPDAVFSESDPEPIGSYVLDARKFPSFTGTPVERLRKYADRIKADGWGGLAVWVPVQAFGESPNRMLSADQLSRVLRASVEEFRDAGVNYLKVDYGFRDVSIDYRRLLSDIVASEAPGITVEHASVSGPLNDFPSGPGDKTVVHKTGRYRSWADGAFLRRAVELLEFSDVLRMYDALELLKTSTRLDRIADVLSAARGMRKSPILNSEDCVYTAAALGCSMGVLRYPNPKDPKPRIREVLRAARWQRIAPPFPAHMGRLEVDERVLTDSFKYTTETADVWMPSLAGQFITQSAPARIARGIDLPQVVARHEPPFVAASRHPNGAVAVAALPRTAPGVGSYMPLADVALRIDGDAPVGLFGRFRSVRLELGAPLGGRRVFAQDLASDHAYDITPNVAGDGTSLTVPGELIDWLSVSGDQDGSDPGIVLAIGTRASTV